MQPILCTAQHRQSYGFCTDIAGAMPGAGTAGTFDAGIAGQVVTMIWVPILLGTFKLAVFGTGMFFAIKWHYDQGKKKKAEDARARAEHSPDASE